MKAIYSFAVRLSVLCGLAFIEKPLLANIPGGGTGTGADVTITDNGSTATIANGIVSIVCVKSSAVLSQINYTYNNSGAPVTNQLLNGGKDGGEFYWETGGWGSGSFNYSVVANNGNYCEIDLLSTSPTTNGVMDVHFSMLRGSPGFYVTAIWSHRVGDGAIGMGETRDNIYLNPEFTWNTIDANRNFQYNLGGTGGAVPVFGAPKEVSLWTNGIAQGRYEDKYKYVADFGTERVWGWSSVNNPAAGFTGQNVGIWHILASTEYYNGGPMKPELMDAPMVNMLNGGHYYMGNDSEFGQNEVWTRVQGPYFIYCNNVTNTLTQPFQTAEALYDDALAQATAEQSAWPYSWFTNASYAAASQRGAVTGQLVIADAGNPNPSASNMWVGVIQQPTTINAVYDSQLWMKPYQFWVKTDANGNFTIPNVIAGNNYTLWAFGPGINGTFLSQSQSGNYPDLLYTTPSAQFGINVTAGATNNLGSIVWTNASRVGATVFEIGYPDRTARKFRHGEDWWVGDIGPSPTNPIPVWSKFLEYPFDFPNGVNYVVGQSRWSTDWNFIQPNVVDSAGNMNGSTSTITFNLASAPTSGAKASIYIGLASDDAGPLIVSVNGQNLSSASGLVAAPVTSIPSTGYFPIGISSANSIGYGTSDTSIREGINAAFSDERLTFNASVLQEGQNTITINMRKGGSLDNHAMYDYIRLELTGYVPPPPSSVAAYAGNNCNLVCWPVTPGATSYNIYSTTTSGSGYKLVANVTGPVCGSGFNNATFLDTNAVNGATYYYVVQSVNPTGTSTDSPESSGATPSGSIPASVPVAPSGVNVSSVAHHSVTLNWSGSPGANYYTIYRSTLVDTLGGASNVLKTIVLNNTNTGTSYTDTSPTDGSIYSYFLTATSAGGTSANSISAVGVPLPAPPASAPASLTGSFVQTTNILLNWSAVPDTVGYDIFRSTSPSGPFTLASGYVQCITETTYTDVGLSAGGPYYYEVMAVNAAGVSSPATVTVVALPAAPTSLSAVPGNAMVTLSWSSVSGASGYYLYSGIVSNNVTTLVAANYAGTSYTNTGLTDGTTYYYFVSATNAAGLGPFSPEASATPGAVAAAAQNLIWKGDGSANVWNIGTANWLSNTVVTAYNDGDTVTFNDNGSNNVPVALTGALQPALVIVTNSTNHSYTFSGAGSITGTNTFIKTGPGALTVGATDTYTGGTIVSNGMMTFSIAQAIPASGVISLYNTGAVTVATANGLPNVQVNGADAITGNGNSGTGISTLDVEGTLKLLVSGGSKVFDLTGTMTGGGTIMLANSSAMTLRFNGTSGNGSAIFNLGTQANFASVRNGATAIALGGLAGGATTTLQGNSSAGSAVTYTIGGANVNAEFDGVIANGAFSGNPATIIIKTGTGTQILTNANTYTGGTTVSGGILLVNNSGGSGTGSGAVTVNSGGALGGNGIISGAVTVNSGGALAPGNRLGTFTINNSLTLVGGSTTFVQVQHSPLTNDSVTVSGTLTENGTLNATNISGALASGDSFKLFNAGTFAGAFAHFVLPSLPAGLAWNTSTLAVNGTLSIVVTSAPVFMPGGFYLSGNNLIFSGTGGVANAYFYLLGSTNLTTPVANWTRLLTNQFDNSGNFNITSPANANSPQYFFLLNLP